jgi:hypothetical protein
MNLGAKRAGPIRDGKFKQVRSRSPHPVHLALPKGLAGSGPAHPFRTGRTAGDAARGSEWSPDPLYIRLESELSSGVWDHRESAVRKRGGNVEEFLSVLEVAL